VRLMQVQHAGLLSGSKPARAPDAVMASPPGGGRLPPTALGIGPCCLLRPPRLPETLLQGRIHASTPGQQQQEGQNALRLFSGQRRGENPGGCEKADPTGRRALPCVPSQALCGRPARGMPRMGRQHKTTLRLSPGLATGASRGAGALSQVCNALGGRPGGGAPAVALARHSAHHAACAACPPAGLPRVGGVPGEPPGGSPAPVEPRRTRRPPPAVCSRQRLMPPRHPARPRATAPWAKWPQCSAGSSALSAPRAGPWGAVRRCGTCSLTTRPNSTRSLVCPLRGCRSTGMPAGGGYDPRAPDRMAGRAGGTAGARGDGPGRGVRCCTAGRAPIARDAGRPPRRIGSRHAPTCRRRRRHQARARSAPTAVAGIPGAPAHVVVEMGCGHPRPDEALGGVGREKARPQRPPRMAPAPAVEHHRLARGPQRDRARGQGLWHSPLPHLPQPPGIDHPCTQPPLSEPLTLRGRPGLSA
jgi:hypothetical protein